MPAAAAGSGCGGLAGLVFWPGAVVLCDRRGWAGELGPGVPAGPRGGDVLGLAPGLLGGEAGGPVTPNVKDHPGLEVAGAAGGRLAGCWPGDCGAVSSTNGRKTHQRSQARSALTCGNAVS
jgi:hypothetical protein